MGKRHRLRDPGHDDRLDEAAGHASQRGDVPETADHGEVAPQAQRGQGGEDQLPDRLPGLRRAVGRAGDRQPHPRLRQRGRDDSLHPVGAGEKNGARGQGLPEPAGGEQPRRLLHAALAGQVPAGPARADEGGLGLEDRRRREKLQGGVLHARRWPGRTRGGVRGDRVRRPEGDPQGHPGCPTSRPLREPPDPRAVESDRGSARHPARLPDLGRDQAAQGRRLL